jgi:hypothetical protein
VIFGTVAFPLRGRQLAGDHVERFRAEFDVRTWVGPQAAGVVIALCRT